MGHGGGAWGGVGGYGVWGGFELGMGSGSPPGGEYDWEGVY